MIPQSQTELRRITEYYTYDSDTYCYSCTYHRFGSDFEDSVDKEGNPIGYVSPWDESPADLKKEDGGHSVVCRCCGEIIREHIK